jgi:hypothetical protein
LQLLAPDHRQAPVRPTSTGIIRISAKWRSTFITCGDNGGSARLPASHRIDGALEASRIVRSGFAIAIQ